MTRQLLVQFSRFGLVGGLGFMVDAGITLLLIAFGIGPLIARAVAIAAAMFVTWRLNRALTFGASADSQIREGTRYFIVAIGAALFNFSVYAGLLWFFPSLGAFLPICIAVAASTLISFIGYRKFAFKSAA
ncbi:MAG: GtrA family protein [Pseudomonadota bacterium]